MEYDRCGDRGDRSIETFVLAPERKLVRGRGGPIGSASTFYSVADSVSPLRRRDADCTSLRVPRLGRAALASLDRLAIGRHDLVADDDPAERGRVRRRQELLPGLPHGKVERARRHVLRSLPARWHDACNRPR